MVAWSGLGPKMVIDTDFGSRPAFAAAARSAGILSTMPGARKPMGIQPSQNSTTRSKVVGPSPPMRIGGGGFCEGLGLGPIQPDLTYLHRTPAPSFLRRSPLAITPLFGSARPGLTDVPMVPIHSAAHA